MMSRGRGISSAFFLSLVLMSHAWAADAPVPAKKTAAQSAQATTAKKPADTAGKVVPYKDRIPDYTHTQVSTHACVETDVMGGMWKMVYSRQEPPGRFTRMNKRFRHQYRSFTPDHYYGFMMTGHSIDDAALAKRAMRIETRGPFAQTYAVNTSDTKAEILFAVGGKANKRMSCSIVAKPTGIFLEGDMILIGYTKNNAVLYELYRRWF